MLENLLLADRWLFKTINTGMANSVLDFICPFLRMQQVWYPLYFILIVVLIKLFNKKALYIILVAALLVLCTDQFSAKLIKNIFMRTRPCAEPLLQGQMRHLIESCRGYSFVSAHATNHFAIAAYLSIFFSIHAKWAKPLLFFWAFAVSLSQIYVGVHYPLDILAGAAIGILFGIAFGKYLFRLLNLKVE
ncbi:MAG: phosphatase PAP2 family protein [Bacteroidia bacterium]